MPKKNEIKALAPWEIEFVKLRQQGWKMTQIVKKAKLTTYSGDPLTDKEAISFSKTKRYREAIRKATVNSSKDLKEDLKVLSVKAMSVMEEALLSDNEKVRIDAAKDILNRAGVKSADLQLKSSLNLTAKDLDKYLLELKNLNNYKEEVGGFLNDSKIINLTANDEKTYSKDSPPASENEEEEENFIV